MPDKQKENKQIAGTRVQLGVTMLMRKDGTFDSAARPSDQAKKNTSCNGVVILPAEGAHPTSLVTLQAMQLQLLTWNNHVDAENEIGRWVTRVACDSDVRHEMRSRRGTDGASCTREIPGNY